MRMNNLIFILFMLCNFGCDRLADHAYFFKVQNNSDDTIRCYTSYNYPDTSLAVSKPLLQMVKPKAYTEFESNQKWEDVLPKDTILIYILSEDTVDAYSWDIIRNKYNILKRYELSVGDLKKSNWIVTYP